VIYHIQDNQAVELRSNYIEYLFSSYVPDQSLIVSDGQSLDTAIPDDIKYLVFNDATNPLDAAQHLNQIATDLPFCILSGSYPYFKNPIPQIKFFPFWAVWMSDPYSGLMRMRPHKFSSLPKRYNISCLNGTAWEHRQLVYLELSRRDYFKDLVFTFGNRDTYSNINERLMLDQELDEFAQLPKTVAFIPSDAEKEIDVSINHPAYLETYVNLVTETTVKASTPMLSEKTFKPIIAGQLFVLVASPGAIQFLRDVGIDTFDDIIDHSYDSILDTRTRILSALVQVDRLSQMDLKELYNQIKPRLERNSDYFLSQEFRNQFLLRFN
jgi:hypothetical protein